VRRWEEWEDTKGGLDSIKLIEELKSPLASYRDFWTVREREEREEREGRGFVREWRSTRSDEGD
jgi:hypothetical protein